MKSACLLRRPARRARETPDRFGHGTTVEREDQVALLVRADGAARSGRRPRQARERPREADTSAVRVLLSPRREVAGHDGTIGHHGPEVATGVAIAAIAEGRPALQAIEIARGRTDRLALSLSPAQARGYVGVGPRAEARIQPGPVVEALLVGGLEVGPEAVLRREGEDVVDDA